MANNLNNGIQSSKEFLIKRMCRIIPPYYLITLCVAGSSVESWLETLKSMLFIPLDGNYTGPVYGYARLLAGWTLNYEVLFYLISAFAIAFNKNKWIILFFIISLLTIAPSLFFGWNGLSAVAGYDFNNVYLKLMTNPLMLEFIMGVFIGWVLSKNIKISMKIFWISLLSVSWVFFFYVYFTGVLWGNSPRGFMLPCALLLFSVVEYEKRCGIKWPAWIINTGTVSFSIYLIHTQALSLISKLARVIEKIGIPLPGVMVSVLAIGLTFMLSRLSYEYIEIGLSQWIRNRLFSVKNDKIVLEQQA